MKIPLLDLKRQYETIREDLEAAILEVARSTRYIGGAKIEEVERAVAQYVGTSSAVAVSSGTDALIASLMALDIGPNDEVITTPYSFFATVEAIVRLGAKPVLADIDPDTFNIDPEQVAKAVTKQTKAIVVVHLFGQCADMDPILQVGEIHGIPVIEDAAQAIGSTYRGKFAGSMGKCGCLSFFPSKNLGAMGDAGMVVTTDDGLADRLRLIRTHGAEGKHVHRFVGGNFRMDPMQAAIILTKLPHLEKWTEARRKNADTYLNLLQQRQGGNHILSLPVERHYRHVYNQFVLACENRDELEASLLGKGIGCAVYYPLPFHHQPCLAHLPYGPGDFPHAERASLQSLAIPIFPELRPEELTEIVDAIASAF